MKKLLAIIAAGVMTFAMGITAFAAPSVSSSAANVLVPEGKNAVVKIGDTESNVKVIFSPVSEAVKEAGLTKIAELAGEKAATVVGISDITIELDGEYQSVTMPLTASGIKAGDSVYILHQKQDGSWEVIIPDSVEDGIVTATFTSLSPVIIVKGEIPADTAAGVKSPKTGESTVPFYAVAIICFAGAVYSTKKFATR